MSITEEKKKRKKSVFWIIILIISTIIFAIAAALLVMQFWPQTEDYSGFKNEANSSESSVVLADNPINFKALWEENPEICAWIKLDGTVIDYPILRSGNDTPEDFYLDHDMYGVKKRAGSIYIQRLNSGDFTDKNTLIYGHNMLNGTMFAALKKFRNKDFFEQNQTITVYTPGHIYTYKIFSAFLYDDRHILNAFYLDPEEGHPKFLEDCLNPPTFVKNVREGVEVTENDKIITLSTCTSAEKERYLVTAVLVNDTLTK